MEPRAAINTHREYAETLLTFFLHEADAGAVDKARGASGLATNNVEASVSRTLLEPGCSGRERLATAMVIDAALRRFAGPLSAMQLDPTLGDAFPADFWRE